MSELRITVTEKAVSKLREVMEREGHQSSGVLVAVVRTHCMGGRGFANKLQFYSPTDGDELFELNGLKVCVDRDSARYFQGSEIDFVEADGQEGFSINNPNVRSKCPCGRHNIFE